MNETNSKVSQGQSVFKNYIFNTALNISNILFPIVTFSYVSHLFGPEIIGKISTAAALSGYFAFLTCLGIPIYGTSLIGKFRNDPGAKNKIFSEFVILIACAAVIFFTIYVGIISLYPQFKKEYWLFLIFGFNILLTGISFDWAFQGLEKYPYITIRNIIVKCITLIAILLFVHTKQDILKYAIIGFVSGIVVNLHGIIYLKSFIRFTPDQINIFPHIKILLFAFGIVLFGSIYTFLDSVILSIMAGNIAVGYYGTAVRIDKIVLTIAASLSMILVPRVSYYLGAGDTEAYNKAMQKSLHFIYCIAFPSITGLMVLAPFIIPLISGDEFIPAILICRIGSLLIIIISLSGLIAYQIFVSRGQLKYFFMSVLTAAIVSVILNIALIPKYKEIGAIIATVSAELFALLILILGAHHKKFIRFNLFDRHCLKYLIASLVMSLVLKMICSITILVVWQLLLLAGIAGVISYVLVLIYFKDYLIGDLQKSVLMRFRK